MEFLATSRIIPKKLIHFWSFRTCPKTHFFVSYSNNVSFNHRYNSLDLKTVIMYEAKPPYLFMQNQHTRGVNWTTHPRVLIATRKSKKCDASSTVARV